MVSVLVGVSWLAVFALLVFRGFKEDLVDILCLHGLGVGGSMEKKGKNIFEVFPKLLGVGLTDFL